MRLRWWQRAGYWLLGKLGFRGERNDGESDL